MTGQVRGRRSNRWKGGITVKRGRVLIWMPNHPKAGQNGYVKRTILVWEEHHGPVPEGYEIHHKDEIVDHDVIDNLEILTKSEHTRLHNLLGERISKRILSEERAIEIQRLYRMGKTPDQLASMFEVSRSTIVRVTKGKYWLSQTDGSRRCPIHTS